MSFFGEKPDFDLSLSSTLARNWTVVVARGVLGLVIGLIAFLFPGPTLLSLIGLFAVFLIIDGILAIVAAVRAASKHERWGFLTFEGIVGIVAGVLAMALPGLTVFVFVGLLAAWALTHRLIFIRPGDSLSQPSSVQQSYITPRLSDRHSLTFVEHSKVSDILFAILPNQIIVAQISS